MEYITKHQIPEVKAGADWADEKYPGWANQIDLETLDMQNGDGQCALCQMGGYKDWEVALRVEQLGALISDGVFAPATLGFTVTLVFRPDETYAQAGEQYVSKYRALTAAWTEEVLARRGVYTMPRLAVAEVVA